MQTLTLTDIATDWTECAPMLVREQRLLTEVLSELRKLLPFRLEQQLADHRVSLTHLDAIMRLFDPDLLLQDAEPQQRVRVSWFRPGECLRTIDDVLCEAPAATDNP